MINQYNVSTLMDVFSRSLSSPFDTQLVIVKQFYFDQKGYIYIK